jgi:TrmH RNA methyltransferase
VVYGLNACRSVFKNRPGDLLRVFFHESRRRDLMEVKKWCSTHKLPYRKLDDESLNKVAASVHHEGVVMVVRPMRIAPVRSLIRQGLPEGEVALALDRVENPHNLGAILRSAAYFGAAGVILEAAEGERVFSPSAVRMAEGGLECVPCYQAGDLPSALRDIRGRGLFVLGADIRSSLSIYDAPLKFPCVVVFGNEREGLSERARKRCDAIVHVPGRGHVESLNVSVAAGVILAELFRRRTGAG